jgi:hypothetical protein
MSGSFPIEKSTLDLYEKVSLQFPDFFRTHSHIQNKRFKSNQGSAHEIIIEDLSGKNINRNKILPLPAILPWKMLLFQIAQLNSRRLVIAVFPMPDLLIRASRRAFPKFFLFLRLAAQPLIPPSLCIILIHHGFLVLIVSPNFQALWNTLCRNLFKINNPYQAGAPLSAPIIIVMPQP